MTPYGTTTGLGQYITARGYTLPDGDDAAALLRGSMSLDANYATRWIGQKASFANERAWPRVDATWPDGSTVVGIPDQVVQAAYELSYQELRKPGSTTVNIAPGTMRRRARVEGAVDVEYARDWNSADNIESMTPVSLVVEGLLYGLIGSRVALPGVLVV